jgi:UDP-N-acetylmuramoylalanine--D-glutamate ligase
MPHPTSWADLTGRKVAVWGAGVEGQASLRKLHDLGITPVVVDPVGGTTPDGAAVIGLDDGGADALRACDIVIKSPGISRYDEPAASLIAAADVELVGGLGLWLAGADSDRVLAITGTKGKSTTTSIVGGLLSAMGYRTMTGGNLGHPPWDPAYDEDFDWWVIEVSSYQAADLAAGPAVVALTSLSQDHLTWHHGAANYYRDKLSLCTRPGVRTVVAEGHDPLIRSHADQLGPHVRWVTDDVGEWAGSLGLLGQHNARNAAVAQAAMQALGVAEASDPTAMRDAAAAYVPLPSRLTLLGEVDGVAFVDDSLSTNVLPTLAAVETFAGRRVALLVGGHDRGIDYQPLADGLASRDDDTLVLTLPDNGPQIGAVISVAPGAPRVVDCPDLPAAVLAGYEWARPDGVVLLSPAAPSFGRFADYKARAATFVAAMQTLSSRPS